LLHPFKPPSGVIDWLGIILACTVLLASAKYSGYLHGTIKRNEKKEATLKGKGGALVLVRYVLTCIIEKKKETCHHGEVNSPCLSCPNGDDDDDDDDGENINIQYENIDGRG
jgi:hypothetical protein